MDQVTMVRIYTSEGDHQLNRLVELLREEEQVRGVTTFRGVLGFGPSGHTHSASLLDLSLDLPLVIEFFDEPAKVERILERLNTMIKPGHVVCWPATVNTGN